jgi:hypothetical protein
MVLRIEKVPKSFVDGGIGKANRATAIETLWIRTTQNGGGTSGLLKGVLP